MTHNQKIYLIKAATQGPGFIGQLKDTIASQFKTEPSNDEINAILGVITGTGIGAATEGWKGALTGGITGGIGGYLMQNKDFFGGKKNETPKNETPKTEPAVDTRNFIERNPRLSGGLAASGGLWYGAKKIDNHVPTSSHYPQAKNDAHLRSLNRSSTAAKWGAGAAPVIGLLADYASNYFKGNK